MSQHIITGNGAPTIAPTALAQHYVDLTNGAIYQSTGTNSAADWKPSTSVTNEQLQDVIGPMFDNTASTPISSTYDDANNRVVISINQSQINHNSLQNVGTNSHVQIDNHISNTANPHSVTKSQVGLSNVQNIDTSNPANINQSASYRFVTDIEKTSWNSKEPAISLGTTSQYFRGDKTFQTLDKNSVGLNNVDNTSDANKPISTATQTALNAKLNSSEKGVANGVATLDATVKIPVAQIPTLPYAPTSHTHTASQITDFTTAVQAVGDIRYAEAGHTHPNATTSTAGFMSGADKTKLDGLVNAVFPKTVTVLNNSSQTTFTTITELQINCVSGKVYKFTYFLRHISNATTTGITFSINGTASGSIGAKAFMATSRTATSIPSLNSFSGLLAITSVPSTSPEVSIIEGLFVCTGNGTMYPQFRSETNGNNVQILDNSLLEYNEI